MKKKPNWWQHLNLGFQIQLRTAKLPASQTEFKLDENDKRPFDHAWPPFKVLLEIQGGMFTQGAHSRGPRAKKDFEKHAEAVCRGWKLVTFTPDQVADGIAIKYLRRLLKPLTVVR